MNKAVPILIVTTVAASLACMHLVRALRAERTRNEALQSRVTQLEQATAERERSANAPAPLTPFSGLQTSPGLAPVHEQPEQDDKPAVNAASRSAMAPPEIQERMREHMKRQRELMQDPKYLEAMRKQQRAHMPSIYPGLTEALGLSADETNRFLDLLSKQMVEQSTLYVDDDPTEMRRAQEAAMERRRQQEAELESQFGPEVNQKWQEYQQTVGQRHRVAQMQSSLALAGAPLNAEQSKTVLDALVTEQRRQMDEASSKSSNQSGWAPFPGAGMNGDPTEWVKNQERSHERILDAVSPSLSSQQLAHLEDMYAREREAMRASMELQRAQGLGNEQGVIATSAPNAFFAVGSGVIEISEDASQEEAEQ
jgi:hypothetical protein